MEVEASVATPGTEGSSPKPWSVSSGWSLWFAGRTVVQMIAEPCIDQRANEKVDTPSNRHMIHHHTSR